MDKKIELQNDNDDIEEEENYDCPLHGPQEGPDCARC